MANTATWRISVAIMDTEGEVLWPTTPLRPGRNRIFIVLGDDLFRWATDTSAAIGRRIEAMPRRAAIVSGIDVQQRIGSDDSLDLPIRVRRRSPLQELNDYPFFDLEEERPAPSWAIRHGRLCLAALAITSAIEVAVLGLLLR
jgi:hypothetical protein